MIARDEPDQSVIAFPASAFLLVCHPERGGRVEGPPRSDDVRLFSHIFSGDAKPLRRSVAEAEAKLRGCASDGAGERPYPARPFGRGLKIPPLPCPGRGPVREPPIEILIASKQSAMHRVSMYNEEMTTYLTIGRAIWWGALAILLVSLIHMRNNGTASLFTRKWRSSTAALLAGLGTPLVISQFWPPRTISIPEWILLTTFLLLLWALFATWQALTNLSRRYFRTVVSVNW